jgi:hypothetical protein
MLTYLFIIQIALKDERTQRDIVMGEIHIQGLNFNGHKIINNIAVSQNLKKYIKSSTMFVDYDTEIYADESILNIPFIATVLPVAWLTGSDIFMNTIDKGFKKSMENIQLIYKDMYPLIPFTTKIIAQQLVDNKTHLENPESRTGLLYSGGIDSTYSMITNLQEKPRLIMHWGVERTPYPLDMNHWELAIATYTKLAEKYGLTLNVTKTNALELLYQRKIEHRFHKELFYGSFWVRLQHSLVLLSLTAPLSVKRFDRLLIAASSWPESTETFDRFNPYPQIPEIDDKISWANLKVKHDGYIERYKKTKAIAQFSKKDDLELRVCLNRRESATSLNCNNCPKCFMTIAQLVQAEADPNKFGFKIDNSTWDVMKSYIIQLKELVYSEYNTQELIPDVIEYDLYGGKEYLEWLRDFKSTKKKKVWLYRDIYDFLPYPFAKVLNEIYKMLKINIHGDATPFLPQKKIDYLSSIIENVNPNWIMRTNTRALEKTRGRDS